MTGFFKWLDFSNAEKERTLTILASLKEKGTVDDLGIGAVRDAVAEHLFPGINTIQTRAKYFLFIPWIFQGLENSRIPDDKLEMALRDREIKLIDALMGDAKALRDRDGLIGKEARETLKRFPSSIYWNGLRQFGICKFDGSLSDYLQSLPESRVLGRRRVRHLESTGEPEEFWGNWDGALPQTESLFLDDSLFELNFDQASYLRERSYECQAPTSSDTLLAWCLRKIETLDPYDYQFPWDMVSVKGMPSHLRANLRHARNFSLCVHGAYAVYYYLLAKKLEQPELLKKYETDLHSWMESISEVQDDLCLWFDDVGEFWKWVKLANMKLDRDIEFINSWCAVLRAMNFMPSKTSQLVTAKTTQLIKDREYRLKKGLARLSHPKVLERWEANVSSGPLVYRWLNAARFMSDIRSGLLKKKRVRHA